MLVKEFFAISGDTLPSDDEDIREPGVIEEENAGFAAPDEDI